LKKRTKRTFAIHHWCGLIAGIFLLVISLSGSMLVFHDEIDEFLFKKELSLGHTAQKLSIDRSFEKIRSRYPGWEVRIPGLPEKENQALKYELRKGNQRWWVVVHPGTGQVLHTFDRTDKRLVHVLLTLHYSFFGGTIGKVLVFICGVAFLTLLTTGVILYRKAILRVLLFRQQISFKSKRSFFSSLHRVLGVWGLLFNLLIVVTGLWTANLVIASALKTTGAHIQTPPFLPSIDQVLKEVKTQMPTFEINYLRFPAQASENLQISGRLESDPAYYGKFYSRVQVDSRTGQVIKVQLLRDKPWRERVTTVLTPLHFGNYAGLWVKILYTIGGLLPGILSLSGFLIWRYRSAGKSKHHHVKSLTLTRQK